MRFLENAPKEDPNAKEETKAKENVNGIDENATNITIVVENTGYIFFAAVMVYHEQPKTTSH